MDAKESYRRDGFVVARGLVGADERAEIAAHYTKLREQSLADGWPRMLQVHLEDGFSLRLLVDRRLLGTVAEVTGAEVRGFQTMWYWKPPGTLGQALHQDEFYVRSVGGPCVAAWLALDATDDHNGGLRVVPGSHRTPVQRPHAADPTVSTSRHEVDVPPGLDVTPVEMAAGDVLFFDGRLIHGSRPNRSPDRWRRTFIAHYLPATATACAEGYTRLFAADGGVTDIDAHPEEQAPAPAPAPETVR
jgi:phytanoyl-CoA hydroxylase